MKKEMFFAPILLALFPVVFLFAHNREEVLYAELMLPVLTAVLSALGISFGALLISKILKRDQFHASVLASVLVIAFWYYGFFYEGIYPLLVEKGSFWIELSRQRTLLPLWLGSFGAASLFILKVWLPWRKIVRPLHVFAFVLLLVPVGNLVIYELTHQSSPAVPFLQEPSEKSSFLPDIYYIIPDGYANSEILSRFFGYDNSEFLEFLRLKGFYVLEESRSNYASTRFSLPSTFNMEYLSSSALDYTRELTERNKVALFLKEHGYKFIFVGSGSSIMTGEEADVRFTNNDFYRIVQSITVLSPLWEPRSKILNAFSNIEKVAKLESPKFVIVHILVPHVPYIFGENGEYIGNNPGQKDTARDMELYLGQLKFANKKLQEAVDVILASSGSQAPIILMQSDHGVHLTEGWLEDDEERAKLQLQNFAAFLLPRKEAVLPEPWSAVNTFRFVFDLYFATDFGLLENRYWPSGTSF